MGISYKKRKIRENKNEKSEKSEVEVEKNQEKKTRKKKSFWAKWSRLFRKSSKKKNMIENPQDDIQETPNKMVNFQTLDMKRWELEEAKTQVLNIPIEPGRQVSTIVLSPTKTGFKAVIAHNRISPDLAQGLAKDLKRTPRELENRRTLTLVFDMNVNTLNDAAVGRSECTFAESKHKPFEKNNKDMSASALFVRTGVDEIVESAGFLQAQLSLHNPIIQSQISLPEEVESLNTQRPISWQNLQKSRVTFKTKSEPMWREKQNMLKETVISHNIEDMLNQFIFLDQDESFMNYSNMIKEVSSRKDFIGAKKPISYEEASILGLVQCNKEDMKRDQMIFTSKMSFSLDKLTPLTPSIARNVAPNVLVNIKPFKQHINISRPDFSKMTISGTEKITVSPKKTATKLGSTVKKITSFTRPKECISKTEPRLILSPNRNNRLSVCLRCGVKVKGGEPNSRKDKISRVKRNISDKKDGDSEADMIEAKKSSPEGVEEGKKCTLCSTWKMYNKKNFGSVNLSKSIENILEEFKGYDHNTMFRSNLSQFRRKIKPSESPVEFKRSHSSLSFAEVVELEEGKALGLKNSIQSNIDRKFSRLPNVTLRLIEFVRENGEKTVTFERIKKSEKIEIEDFMKPSLNNLIMENLSLIYNFHGRKNPIKIEAEKIEEFLSKRFVNAFDLYIPQETVIIICPVYWNHLPIITLSVQKSDDQLQYCRGSLSRRTGQIPTIISHLWTEKIDDVRNELLMRMNETRICYDSSRVDSSQTINLKDSEKIINEDMTTTEISEIFNFGGISSTSINGFNNWIGYSDIPNISEKFEEDGPISFIHNQMEQESNGSSNESIKESNQDDDSEKFYLKDLQSTGPNDPIIPFTNSDFKIYTCLMFFEPQFQQIQTAMEIHNNVSYNFFVRKEENQIDKNRLQIMQSCTFISDKKKFFIINELESVVMKECIEKNIMNGEITQMTSKKEIISIKGSNSGNHLLVTNKKILTTSDRIKKSEILIGEIKNEEINENEKNENILMQESLQNIEDLNDVHCLYYKQTSESGESSIMSNSLDEKMNESQNSIIVIREPEENKKKRDDISQIKESETFYCEKSTIKNEIMNLNIENLSLDEIEFDTKEQISKNPMKSLSTNFLPKKTCDATVACDQFSSGSSSLSEDLKIENKNERMSNIKATQSSPCDSQTESTSIIEKLTINDSEKNGDMDRENTVNKVEKGMKTQNLTISTNIEKIDICHGDIISQMEEPSQSINTTNNNQERKTLKIIEKDFRARGIIQTVEAKCRVLKSRILTNEDEPNNNKLATRNRSIVKSHFVPRKRIPKKVV